MIRINLHCTKYVRLRCWRIFFDPKYWWHINDQNKPTLREICHIMLLARVYVSLLPVDCYASPSSAVSKSYGHNPKAFVDQHVPEPTLLQIWATWKQTCTHIYYNMDPSQTLMSDQRHALNTSKCVCTFQVGVRITVYSTPANDRGAEANRGEGPGHFYPNPSPTFPRLQEALQGVRYTS